MIVAFLPVGGSQWVWARRQELLDFERHCAVKEAEARAAAREGRLGRHADGIKQAVQVWGGARGWLWLLVCCAKWHPALCLAAWGTEWARRRHQAGSAGMVLGLGNQGLVWVVGVQCACSGGG